MQDDYVNLAIHSPVLRLKHKRLSSVATERDPGPMV